jgi:hypothetical protein
MNKDPIYKPFKLLAIGDYFRDVEQGTLFMKVGCTDADTGKVQFPSVSAGGGFMNRFTVNCVALEPHKFKGQTFGLGDMCQVTENEAVVVVESADLHSQLRRERDICAEGLREIHRAANELGIVNEPLSTQWVKDIASKAITNAGGSL